MLDSVQSTKLINEEKINMDKLNISVYKGKLKSWFYDMFLLWVTILVFWSV